jgi:thiol-disulfide isomerase/thioredoxin
MHKLESMMKKMNLTVVLVYADWCGHCHTYKDTVWKHLEGMPNKKVGLAKLNEKALADSPLSSAKINGYPSVLVVGKDGKPAEFKDESTGEATNAMPNARDVEMMKGLVTGANASSKMPNVSQYPKTIYIGKESNVSKKAEEAVELSDELNVESKSLLNEPSANEDITPADEPEMVEPGNMNAYNPVSGPTDAGNASGANVNMNNTNPTENASAILVNSESPVSSKVLPPSASDDLLDTNASVTAVSGPENSSQLGGSLYMALLESAKATAPAAILTAAAAMKSRRSRRAKSRK